MAVHEQMTNIILSFVLWCFNDIGRKQLPLHLVKILLVAPHSIFPNEIHIFFLRIAGSHDMYAVHSQPLTGIESCRRVRV